MKVKFGEVFDLGGEPAMIELIERRDLKSGEMYYIAKLLLVGRFPPDKFTRSEVEEKNLRIVPL